MDESKKHARRGMTMVLAAAMLWGTTGTAQSFAPPQLSSYWIGATRLLVAALFFLPALRLRGLPWRGIAFGAVCMCAYNLAFFAGVRASSVAIGTAIALGSGPVWAGLLQMAITRQLPSAHWWLGTGAAVVGVCTMAIANGGPERGSTMAGAALCLGAGLSYASYSLVNQRMVASAPPAAVAAAVFIGAALLAVPGAFLISGKLVLHASDAAVLLWLGVMSTGVAYLLYSHALRHVTAATGVVLALAEPVGAFVLAIAVVGEKPGLTGALGLAGVLAGLAFVARNELAAAAPCSNELRLNAGHRERLADRASAAMREHPWGSCANDRQR
jgi:drug/metabolite transporter, DME family